MASHSFNGSDAATLFHLAANPSTENLASALTSLSSDEAREIARALLDPAAFADPAVRESAEALRLWAERRLAPGPART
ncbi:MAG: hypothetical protein HY897_09515 [Deltaproteobacteria bacterium]|nr:hypothetical protein [Deltaproteobacteria bacterium]